MRRLVILGLLPSVLAGALLSGCARDPYVTNAAETRSGNWRIARQFDRVSGTDLPSATVHAEASNSNVDYPRMSSLQLSCFEKQPLVRFAFDFKIGSNPNSELGYRFDDKPGVENVPVRVLAGRQMIVIEEPQAVATFAAGLAGARKLYMRIRSLTSGRTSAEYTLDGSDAALQAAFAGCPVTPPPAGLPARPKGTGRAAT